MGRRYFTLEEAEALVPELSRLMGRALQLHVFLRRTLARLSQLGTKVSSSVLAGKPASTAMSTDARTELREARALYAALIEDVRSVELLGCEIKGVQHGLVDFWSYLDGEDEVLLCWKLGERHISSFYRPKSGLADRCPVHGHRFTRRRDVTNPHS